MIQFGKKLSNIEYPERIGAYAVTIENGKIALMKIETGFFLPGGGIDENESPQEALKREIYEETGYECRIESLIGSAGQYLYSPLKKRYFNKIEHFFRAELLNRSGVKSESDHELVWIELNDSEKLLYEEAQRWAVKQTLFKNSCY